jgi:hypothetical protein
MQNVSAVLSGRLAAFDRTPVQSSIRFEERWQFKATPRGGQIHAVAIADRMDGGAGG